MEEIFRISGGESGSGSGFSLAFWLEAVRNLGSITEYSGQFFGWAADGVGAGGFNFGDLVSDSGPSFGNCRKTIIGYDDGAD